MKKMLMVCSMVLFLAASCQQQNSGQQAVVQEPPATATSSPIIASDRVDVSLGQDFVLKKGQVAYFKGTDVSLKILDFYNHPCPKGSQCFWSGLDVYYQLSVGGKTYAKDNTGAAVDSFPYVVAVKDSDYQTYAKFNVTAKAVSAGPAPGKKLQVCPDEWWEDDMPAPTVTTDGPYDPTVWQYYILNGQRRELSEFDAAWIKQNCKLELQHAY
jgi:hypothetical protein